MVNKEVKMKEIKHNVIYVKPTPNGGVFVVPKEKVNLSFRGKPEPSEITEDPTKAKIKIVRGERIENLFTCKINPSSLKDDPRE